MKLQLSKHAGILSIILAVTSIPFHYYLPGKWETAIVVCSQAVLLYYIMSNYNPTIQNNNILDDPDFIENI